MTTRNAVTLGVLGLLALFGIAAALAAAGMDFTVAFLIVGSAFGLAAGWQMYVEPDEGQTQKTSSHDELVWGGLAIGAVLGLALVVALAKATFAIQPEDADIRWKWFGVLLRDYLVRGIPMVIAGAAATRHGMAWKQRGQVIWFALFGGWAISKYLWVTEANFFDIGKAILTSPLSILLLIGGLFGFRLIIGFWELLQTVGIAMGLMKKKDDEAELKKLRVQLAHADLEDRAARRRGGRDDEPPTPPTGGGGGRPGPRPAPAPPSPTRRPGWRTPGTGGGARSRAVADIGDWRDRMRPTGTC